MGLVHLLENRDKKLVPFPLEHLVELEQDEHASPLHEGVVKNLGRGVIFLFEYLY